MDAHEVVEFNQVDTLHAREPSCHSRVEQKAAQVLVRERERESTETMTGIRQYEGV